MSLLGKSDYSLVPTHVLHEYAAMDADATRRIYFPLVDSLKKQDLAGYYKSFTSKTLRNLIKSSLIGMCIDKDLLNKQGKIFLNAIEELEIHLKKTAGDSFNPNSPKQLVEVCHCVPPKSVPLFPLIDKSVVVVPAPSFNLQYPTKLL